MEDKFTPKEKLLIALMILGAFLLLLWNGHNTEKAIQDCLAEGHTQQFCDGLR